MTSKMYSIGHILSGRGTAHAPLNVYIKRGSLYHSKHKQRFTDHRQHGRQPSLHDSGKIYAHFPFLFM